MGNGEQFSGEALDSMPPSLPGFGLFTFPGRLLGFLIDSYSMGPWRAGKSSGNTAAKAS